MPLSKLTPKSDYRIGERLPPPSGLLLLRVSGGDPEDSGTKREALFMHKGPCRQANSLI